MLIVRREIICILARVILSSQYERFIRNQRLVPVKNRLGIKLITRSEKLTKLSLNGLSVKYT